MEKQRVQGIVPPGEGRAGDRGRSFNGSRDRPIIRYPSRALAGLLGVLVVALPLPFGGVAPSLVSWVCAAAFAVLALALISVEALRDLRPAWAPALCLALVATLGLLQSLSWPAAAVERLSPAHAEAQAKAGELLRTAELPAPPSALSVAPEVSRGVSLRWAATAAWLLAAAAVGLRRRPRRWLVIALLASGLLQILYGAPRWLAQARTLWGVPVAGDASRMRGTFVNPNHFATFMVMILPVAFAVTWWCARRARYEERWERRLLLVGPPLLLWLTCFAALAFSGSRAGMLAAVVGSLVQAALISRGGRAWRGIAAVAVLGALAVGALAASSLSRGFGRWADTTLFDVSWNERLAAYASVLDLWRDYPVLGSGLGTFREAFPITQRRAVPREWWHAHSDFLEVLATVGVVGFVVLAVGVFLVVRRLSRVQRRGHRSEDRAIALAALGALAGALAHEMVDFGLTMPANSVVLVILVGMALTAYRPRPRPVRRQP